jgi:bacillithiol synthase
MLPRSTEVNVHIVARLTWPEAGWGSALANAFVGDALPPELTPPVTLRTASDAMRQAADASFLDALAGEMPAAAAAAWSPLRDPTARVVVTGQQPGCAGGALLVLYKAATAVEVARRTSAATGRPVVPVFWNATDDEDFEEIARIAWPSGTGGLDFLELPRAGRRAGGWVGDLPAAGDQAAAEHMLAALDAPRRAALATCLPATAMDHGDWVGELLARVFPELAILDARSAALRRAAAPLFARYLAQRQAAPGVLHAAAEHVRAAGFSPVLASDSAARALYLTPQRHRQKLADDFRPLEEALRLHPEHVSPSVVLRPLLQDIVLPVIAQVVGPAELAYLMELRGLRTLLGVPEPVLVLRASCTLMEPASWAATQALGILARELVREPEQALQRVAQTSTPRADLAAAFAGLDAALLRLAPEAGARDRATRRLASIRDELAGELDSRARAALVASHPELAPLPALLRPRGRPQERLIAGTWALATWGANSREVLLELAGAHLDALTAGRGEHLVATLE